MSTGDEALRTEEVAQPDEGALALASCRQQGKMAMVRIPLPTRVVLAWSVATMLNMGRMRQPARKARGEMVDRCFERCGSPSMRDFAAGADCDDESAQQVSMEMARPKMRAA